MDNYLFDLDFTPIPTTELTELTEGLPAENYRGLPLKWTKDANGEYVFTENRYYHEGTGVQEFGLDNRYWEIQAAREPIPGTDPVEYTAVPLYKHSFEVVNEEIGGRTGSFGRFELNKTDKNASTGSKRVELSLGARDEEGIPDNEANNSDTWYGFSIYIPGDEDEEEKWEVDNSSSEVIAQWHHGFNKGETIAGPPLTLQIQGEELILKLASSLIYENEIFETIGDLNKKIDREGKQPPDQYHSHFRDGDNDDDIDIELKNLEDMKGNWTDFVFYIDWEDTNDGEIKVWIDGNEEPTATITGPNTYHNERGVYFKSGIYKPDWADKNASDTENRVLYSDNFRILSDGQQIEGYESEFNFVAPWTRGDYLMSIRGGADGKTVFASHLLEANNSGTVNGFAAQPSFNTNFSEYYSEQNWLAGDFNGDGFDDALNIDNNNPNPYQPQEIATVSTHLSDGDGFAEEDAGNSAFIDTIAVSASDSSEGIDAASFDVEKFLVGDFDGDGKDDIANVIGVNRKARVYVHSSNGSGFNTEPSFKNDLSGYWEEAPAENWRPALTGQTWLSGDFNGDGKDDLLNVYEDYVAEDKIAVWTFHSKGDGFDATTSSEFTTYDEITGTVDPKRYLVGDFNGDKRDDLAVISGVPTPNSTSLTTSVAVHFSTGDGFENEPSYTEMLRFYWEHQEWKVGDLNADGKDDLINLYSNKDWTPDSIAVFTHLSTGDGFNPPDSNFNYYNELTGYDGVTDYTALDLNNFLVGNFGVS